MSERSPPLAEGEGDIKRKTSPVQAEGRTEKRARHGSAEMEVDTDSEHLATMLRARALTTIQAIRSQSVPASEISRYNSAEVSRPKIERPQGPGDQTTDPRSILLLSAHKTEV
jgi:transducin (beta)-like 1